MGGVVLTDSFAVCLTFDMYKTEVSEQYSRVAAATAIRNRYYIKSTGRQYGNGALMHGPYFATTLGSGIDSIGSNSPKAKTAEAEAIATYCFPSTSYVTGDAVRSSPILKCQRCLPVR